MREKSLLLVLLMLASCAPREDRRMRAYFNDQWRERLEALRDVNSRDTATAKLLHLEVDKIILVSKDAENPSAAVALSRDLLDSYCANHGLTRSDFPDLTARMSPDEMEMQLRENELGILNRLVMNDSAASGRVFSAH